MNINVTKPTGVICKTQGKYCAEDITVVPVLEEKSATPTESAQEIVPSAGNCGISKLNLGAVQTETKTITPTTSQQTFTPTSGKYFKQVICQAIQAYQGTATPTQGEQTINPTSGKYFSSFKVGAIPSDYIKPTGTLQITENGAYDVSAKANVNVNVPTSGGVEEVATAAAMDALLVEANVGKYYKFTGTTDSNYTNGDLYFVEGAPKVSIKYTDNYVSGYIAYSLDNGATWSDYITTQTTLLTDVTQIKLKSSGLSSGLMIYKGPYGYNGESGVATTVVSPDGQADTRAYETENITITEDTGFYLYCYYD